MQYAIPAVGSKVKITTEHKSIFNDTFGQMQEHVLEGVVVPNNKSTHPGYFSVRVNCEYVPIREILLANVKKLEIDGKKAKATQKAAYEEKTWVVKGSKGDEYTVTKIGSKMSCTCVGFQYRRKCKHVEGVK